ncbi:MAG: YitT family protein [Lachnospiraceae bacterium]|nr:YitT family protein [Lachnospiraceae bacterium]MBQ2030577.1 YitT family protein [Lachnospiraceae bacterium]MBQ2557931.1 YitT family protein [Lachnospiraceae bacterium]MCR5375534.1 YitT family protein [Lachnospiraceae bacterium]
MDKRIGAFFAWLGITIGALLASFSVVCILIPNDAIDYGTAGIAIITSKLSGWNLSVCVAAIFAPFLILGFLLLGKNFGLRAVWGSAVYTVGLELFEKIPFELNTEHFLAVVFGGAILGAGLSLILRGGGCIDGSEIFANIVVSKLSNKTGRSFSMTYLLIGFNACVYLAVFLLINRNAALMSLLVYVVATSVINHFTDRFEAVKQVTMITQDAKGLADAIREELGKTCTIMNSYGLIYGENKTVICYVNYFELPKIKEIISRQGGAFTTISTIDEIVR